MADFLTFKRAIATQWALLTQHDMYRTAVEKDALWEAYLGSFPEGTNPIYRERTEHDCSCCRQFIRAVGNAVAIVDGRLVSLWDVQHTDPTYQVVADAMARLVKSSPIENVFLHGERQAGTDKNYEEPPGGLNTDPGQVITWEHFHVLIPYGRNTGKNYYRDGKDIATELGEKRGHHDVLLRGLTELTLDAVDTVLEIISQNSLYRGAEHQATVATFRALKVKFDGITPAPGQPNAAGRDLYVWQTLARVSPVVSRIRNSAIGTLLIDLSDGTDLEEAVRKFETSIMAPANYKRPTALVSQKMVDAARETVEGLGLTSALGRRYARLADITVNNIIFADHSARQVMRDGVFDGIATQRVVVPKDLSKVETISIDKFIEDVIPHVDTVEVLLENEHEANLVSLIAPEDRNAKPLLKWGNNFSWSYNGDMADSVKERVKRAGGNVTGDLCCRLAWYNFDDLDLHMTEPNGTHIFYADKNPHGTDGQLDVDMNAGGGRTREPVENIFYGFRRRMGEGIYTLGVNQYARRESTNIGFEVEIDYLGSLTRFAYQKAVTGMISVAKMRYTHDGGVEFISSLPSTTASKTMWGLPTHDFHRVSVLMASPNHWDGQAGIGNKHYFFMLAGCANDGQARGFFNEFLRSDLDQHRKVIEIVGSKMRTRETPEQLSGVGFSDTKRAELLVRVKGNFTRTLKITI